VILGCLNVRSLLHKYDDVIELCRDRRIDLLCLTETWHDASESAVLGRLRRTGYSVVDRPRPPAADDDLSVNHGGVLVTLAADVSLSPIAVTQPTTFELVCAQAAIGSSSVIVVVLYRPGCEAVQQKFFDGWLTFSIYSPPTRCPSTSSAISASGSTVPTTLMLSSYGFWLTATVWHFGVTHRSLVMVSFSSGLF